MPAKLDEDSITTCMHCLKIFLGIISVFFLIFGLVTFIVGCVARSNFSLGALENELPSLHEGANLLIFVGLWLVFAGLIGLMGAWRERQTLLIGFFLASFIAFAFLMAAGLWSISIKDKIKHKLDTELQRFVDAATEAKKNNLSTDKSQTMAWIERKFKCCGINSDVDYGANVPDSCEGYREKGCSDSVLKDLKGNIARISGLGVSFGLLSIIGMVTSLTYCCALRETS